jgi:hypothetical protein
VRFLAYAMYVLSSVPDGWGLSAEISVYTARIGRSRAGPASGFAHRENSSSTLLVSAQK